MSTIAIATREPWLPAAAYPYSAVLRTMKRELLLPPDALNADILIAALALYPEEAGTFLFRHRRLSGRRERRAIIYGLFEVLREARHRRRCAGLPLMDRPPWLNKHEEMRAFPLAK